MKMLESNQLQIYRNKINKILTELNQISREREREKGRTKTEENNSAFKYTHKTKQKILYTEYRSDEFINTK